MKRLKVRDKERWKEVSLLAHNADLGRIVRTAVGKFVCLCMTAKNAFGKFVCLCRTAKNTSGKFVCSRNRKTGESMITEINMERKNDKKEESTNT